MPAPQLIAERFTLRPFRPTDIDAYLRACADPDVQRFCPGVPTSATTDQAREYFDLTHAQADAFEKFTWAIDASGVMAGLVSLKLNEQEQAGEIGFFIAPESRGTSLAQEALRVVIAFALDPLGLGFRHVTWRALEDNRASIALAGKLGFAEFAPDPEGIPVRPDHQGRTRQLPAVRATLTRERFAFLGM